MRENQRQDSAARPAPAAEVMQLQPVPKRQTSQLPQTVTVGSFQLEGASLIPQALLLQSLQPWVRSGLSLADLQDAAEAVSEVYRRSGWFARVILPAQDITEGRIHLLIIEARLGQVRVETGGKTLSLDPQLLLDTFTARQSPGEPLRLDAVQRASNLVADLPGIQTTVSLLPGQGKSTVDVLVTAQDKRRVTASTQLDNHGTRSTGDARVSLSASLDNPSGSADQLSLNGSFTAGSQYLRLSYNRRIGADGQRLSLVASAMRYRLLHEFALIEAKGSAETAGLQFSYPLIRAEKGNLSTGLMLEARDYRNRAANADTSLKRAYVASAALSADQTDAWAAGGFTLMGAQLSLGRLDLSAHPINQAADQAGSRTEGNYLKLAWNLAHLQRLNRSVSVWLALNGQLADKNLDSSEQFSLGGPNGVRAYPLLEGSGNSGWLANLELRVSPAPDWQVIGFYDLGRVQTFPSTSGRSRYGLAGLGVGLNCYRPGDWVLRFSLAHRRGSNPAANPSTGMDADGRLALNQVWLSLSKAFQ